MRLKILLHLRQDTLRARHKDYIEWQLPPEGEAGGNMHKFISKLLPCLPTSPEPWELELIDDMLSHENFNIEHLRRGISMIHPFYDEIQLGRSIHLHVNVLEFHHIN